MGTFRSVPQKRDKTKRPHVPSSNNEKAICRITHEGDFYQNIDTESALLVNEMTGSKLQLNEEGGSKTCGEKPFA